MKAQLLKKYSLQIAVHPRRLRGRDGLKRETVEAAGIIRLVDTKSRWACQDLERAIRRHCDDVGDIRILPEVASEVCEHCQEKWIEKSEVYNGGCCEKDELNNPYPLLRQAS